MKHKHSRGFTLIELLICVAIGAIILLVVALLSGMFATIGEGEMTGQVIEVHRALGSWHVEIAPAGSMMPYGKVLYTRDEFLALKAKGYMRAKREVLAHYKGTIRKTISSLTLLEEAQK